MSPLGRQFALDLFGCSPDVLDDLAALEASLRSAATRAGATVVGSAFHRYSPQGVSGVLLLAESHAAIHTWPEHGFGAIDVFTCGELDPEIIARAIALDLGGVESAAVRLDRGRRLP